MSDLEIFSNFLLAGVAIAGGIGSFFVKKIFDKIDCFQEFANSCNARLTALETRSDIYHPKK